MSFEIFYLLVMLILSVMSFVNYYLPAKENLYGVNNFYLFGNKRKQYFGLVGSVAVMINGLYLSIHFVIDKYTENGINFPGYLVLLFILIVLFVLYYIHFDRFVSKTQRGDFADIRYVKRLEEKAFISGVLLGAVLAQLSGSIFIGK